MGAFFGYFEQEPSPLDPVCHLCQVGGQGQGGLTHFLAQTLALDPTVKGQLPQYRHMLVHQNPRIPFMLDLKLQELPT